MFKHLYEKNGRLRSGDNLINSLTESDIKLLSTYPNELELKYKIKMAEMKIFDLTLIHCKNQNCNEIIKYKTLTKGNLPRCCSKSCSSIENKETKNETILKKYGSKENYCDHVKTVQNENSMKKHGMNFQNLPSKKEKTKQTLIERYGVDHNSKIESVKQSRYVNVDGEKTNVMHTKSALEKAENKRKLCRSESIAKAKLTLRKNSNINYVFLDSLESRNTLSLVANQGNCSLMTAYRFLKKNGLMNIEYTENTILEYVKSLGFQCEKSRKIIKPYELDCYIPEANLAIEYDGLYWHSSGSKESEKPNYHLMKTQMCEDMNITLLHIFENEWLDLAKNKIWKSIISHKLGKSKRIYARKCKLVKLNHKTAYDFCEFNHLQGGIYGSEYLGLMHEDVLVQVVIFGKSRYSNKFDLELLRACSLIGHTVVGGTSKLTKNKSFVSYANRRWSNANENVYDKIGLQKTGISKPCYFYVDKNELKHRSSFMKHKLKNKFENFNPELTEVENCYKNGLRRIWDCGNIIYERSINDSF